MEKREYTTAEVTTGLIAMVKHAGNVAQAHRETGIPESTLKNWRNERFSEEYRRLEAEYGAELEGQIVALSRQAAFDYTNIEGRLIAQLEKDLDDGRLRGRDAAQAAAQIAKAKASALDKVLTMTGRPVAITESRDMMDLIRALQEEGVLRLRGAAVAELEPSPDG